MAYKIPEERRLTADKVKSWQFISKEMLLLASEAYNTEDGYFFLPRVGKKETTMKSGFFLCRAQLFEGWRIIAVNVPTEGRSPTWEELKWVRSFFFDEADVLQMYLPGKSTYIDDNTYWLHLFFMEDAAAERTPPFVRYQFRKLAFLPRLYKAIVSKFKKSA